MVTKTIKAEKISPILSAHQKYALGLLAAIALVLLFGFFSLEAGKRQALIKAGVDASTELQMIFNSYCDVSNEKQRKIWISVVKMEFPAWPSDGICGMIGNHGIEQVVVEGKVVQDAVIVSK